MSPMRSPYKCPASNALNGMLGERVQFSLPRITEDGTFKEGLAGTTGVGAIFEGDEEKDADKSSLLSGAILYESEAAYL